MFFQMLTTMLVFTCVWKAVLSSDCSSNEKSISYLDIAKEMIDKAKENYASRQSLPPQNMPLDCEELLKEGKNKSGIYKIWPKSRIIQEKSLDVFCDMKTDGGGWTVIQRRGDYSMPKDYFFREWLSYKAGFGNLDKEFWLGNDNIFALTNQRLYSVRFDMKDVSGQKVYALYDKFWIDDEDHLYTLHIAEYSGDAGDSMIEVHNNKKFTTKDKDNDSHGNNCAQMFKGAWWYGECHHSNLNGLNLRGKHDTYADGINWKSFRDHNESLGFTEIKIRPKSFKRSSMAVELHVTPA